MENDSMALIPQFYAGREVFITGATGFVGKVLVERLLSTCPDIGRLHLLMRIKRDQPAEARLDKLKESPVYDVLRKNNPEQLNKLSLIHGDFNEVDFGFTDNTIDALKDVSIVFHLAATVNMEENLLTAVKVNTIGTMSLLDICHRLPKLAAFIHVSTGYSNAERTLVEETVYPLPRPLDDMIEDSLKGGQMTLEEVKRFVSPKPNSYIFTKTLAETVVKNHGHRGFPVAIFRPTMVSTSLRDPFTGWVQDYNGPIGASVAALKGVMRVVNCNEGLRADFLPVDICANTLIAVAWEMAIDNPSELRVYNCSTSDNPTTWKDLRVNMLQEIRENPIPSIMWYPSFYMITNRYAFKVAELFLETIPLYFIELFMRIFGKNKKRLNLIKLSKRLVGMREALVHFSTHEYWYTTGNVRRLRARLTPPDAAIYNVEPTSICWKDYFKSYARGVGKHLIGDKEAGTPEAKKHLERLLHIHTIVSLILLVLATWSITHVLVRLAGPLGDMLPGPLGTIFRGLLGYFRDNLFLDFS